MSARRCSLTHSRRRVRDVRVGVTLTRHAQRDVRDLVAVIRNLIATPRPSPDLMSARRYTPAHSRRRVRNVRVGVTLARQTRRHVRGLVVVVRNLVATPRPSHDLASA